MLSTKMPYPTSLDHPFVLLDLFYVYECFIGMYLCMYVHHECSWYPGKSKENAEPLGTGVKNGCESPSMCWEPNLGGSSIRATSTLNH